ncbi:hypothetical protein bsdcttw_01270 [Anaerocolumna chitinilytica]|uniref:Pentapeptide repeat-containing protein n=1 Tax=Anaerocolumna chitinilytica TaxID=1727145 RepID=A0A7I8DLD2_9FIRM|nr:hypothetical protein bsdcttw_01270 [Anaerocolumna chitinilytica]
MRCLDILHFLSEARYLSRASFHDSPLSFANVSFANASSVNVSFANISFVNVSFVNVSLLI